jgi:LmbE family N-acetylglucosaminyl deacetylase
VVGEGRDGYDGLTVRVKDPTRRRILQGAGLAALAACSRSGSRGVQAVVAPATGIRYSPEAPVVMVGAHCDDVPLECWHVLANVRPIKVVILFMAVPPEGTQATDERMGAYDAAAYIRTRHAEEREVLARIGIEPIFLSGLDLPYRNGDVPSLGPLAGELARAMPEASLLVAPLGIGLRVRVGTPHYSHVDHKFARDVADSFPAIPKVYYGEVYGLSKSSPDYHELAELTRAYAHWRVELHTLSPDELRAKQQAFHSYRTQIEPMLHAVPDYEQPTVIGSELLCDPSGGAGLALLAARGRRS